MNAYNSNVDLSGIEISSSGSAVHMEGSATLNVLENTILKGLRAISSYGDTVNIGVYDGNNVSAPLIYGGIKIYNSGDTVNFYSGAIYGEIDGTLTPGTGGTIKKETVSETYDGITYTTKTIVSYATSVAKIGSTEYETLQEAVNALDSTTSKTVTLLSDVNECITITKKVGILDLGGYTLSCNGATITIDGDDSADGIGMTIRNGTVSSSGSYGIQLKQGSKLTLSANVTNTNSSGLGVGLDTSMLIVNSPSIINTVGTGISFVYSTVTINGGTFSN